MHINAYDPDARDYCVQVPTQLVDGKYMWEEIQPVFAFDTDEGWIDVPIYVAAGRRFIYRGQSAGLRLFIDYRVVVKGGVIVAEVRHDRPAPVQLRLGMPTT